MSNTINNFIAKKKAMSTFIALKSGESATITKLKEIKSIIKPGFSGEEIEVLRLVCEVDTSEGTFSKTFDNGTAKFAQQLADNNVELGSSFKLTRTGDGPKTVYTISDVVNAKA